MPDMVIIEGVSPHDGEYEIDLATINMEEFHLIKRLTGLVAGEVEDALMRIDTDIFVGLAAVVIQRSGKRVTANVENQLWKAPLGALRVKLEPDSPPEKSQEMPRSSNDEPNQQSEGTSSSGDDGKDASETSEEDSPQATGQPASGLSVISDRESSAA